MTPTQAATAAMERIALETDTLTAAELAERFIADLPEGWALYDLADRDSVREAAREGARSRMRRRRELAGAQRQQGQGEGGDDGDVDEQDVVHGGAV